MNDFIVFSVCIVVALVLWGLRWVTTAALYVSNGCIIIVVFVANYSFYVVILKVRIVMFCKYITIF